MKALVITVGLVTSIGFAACRHPPPAVRLVESWPGCTGDYDAVTKTWTRRGTLQGQYQQVLELYATFKSSDWWAAHAARDARQRGLVGDQLTQECTQAQADAAGPYEVELLVTTWDRNENELDRGDKSVWRVVLVDDAGREYTPLEIIKDRRPKFTIRADFPKYGDFAVAYIARFRRDAPLLGANVHALRLRMSSDRGSVLLTWFAPE